jgi:lysophospholipase L1-like esterase
MGSMLNAVGALHPSAVKMTGEVGRDGGRDCTEASMRRMMKHSILYLADRDSPSFRAGRTAVDLVCAGDSITGWNNFGGVTDWPYRTYPEFLQRLLEPSSLRVANGGIAGEISQNGIGQVRDYLEVFPNSRCFVVGYGTNDLAMSPQVERTSPRIIENIDGMVKAVREGGREPILLNVPYANESMFPRWVSEDLRRMRDYHN